VKIGVMLGDDIGLEVVPECVKVMKAAASRAGLEIDLHPLPIGRHGHEEHGDAYPAMTKAALREEVRTNFRLGSNPAGGFRPEGGPFSAPLARCRGARRTSLHLTDSGRSA
jgi:hypothetical protein